MYGLYLENIMLPITAYYGLFLVLKIVKKQMALIRLYFTSLLMYTHGQRLFMGSLEWILNENDLVIYSHALLVLHTQ